MPALRTRCLLLLSPCLAAAAAAADADPTLKQLQEQLDALKEQVEDLAQQQKAASAEQRLQIKGFADVQFRAADLHGDDGSSDRGNGFALGQFDLFMTASIGPRTSFMAETVIEADEESSVGIDFERLLINYDLAPDWRVSIGRYHTTIGYWNDAYHHGEWLSTSIGRPRVVEFEDGHGLLPSHNVGIQAKGSRELGAALKLDATLEVGNGRGRVPDPPQLSGDANEAKAVNLQLGVSPLRLAPGLRFGGGIYLDRIPDNAPTSVDAGFPVHGEMREVIATAFAHYRQGPWEALGEYYRIIHTTADDATPGEGRGTRATTNAWIAQLGWHHGAWTPYLRADAAAVSGSDRYYDSSDRTLTAGLGLRWDVCTWNALKLQVQRTWISAGDPATPASSAQDGRSDELLLQSAVSF